MTRDQRLITSVDEDEKQAVRMQAAKQEMTMSEFLRIAVLEKVERETGNSISLETANSDPQVTAPTMD